MENISFEQLQSLAQIGDSEAIIELARFYCGSKNFSLAFQTISRFEYIEDAVGYRELGKYYEKGIGTSIDFVKAQKYYIKAYELGDYVAGYLQAVFLSKNERYHEAVQYLTSGLFNNYVPAIKMLGDYYLKGLGLEKNLEIAIKMYSKLLEMGESKYYDVIGKIYYQRKDYFTAFTYFEKGANLFDMEAVYHLAICYAKGQGTNIDNVKAIHYYEIGENHSHAKCIYNLAFHYKNGIGVKKDEEKANQLLIKYEQLNKNNDK